MHACAYLMNDIPRGTLCEDILRSLAPPVHEDPQLNYDLILRMLKDQPVIQDSELDDSLSVTRLKFNEIPEWLKFLNQNPYGFPHKTQFGTIWKAVNMTEKDIQGRTAFVTAVIAGDLKYAEMLAEFAEADVKSPDNRGRTALHWATTKQFPALVNLCLVVGLDSAVKNKDNLTAFDISCQAEDDGISTLFYKHLLEVEKSNPDAALLQLLTLTSEPEDGPAFPGEALFGPVVGNKLPLVMALIRSGVILTTTNKDEETALHVAAKHGHAEVVSTLLVNSSRGVRVNVEAACKDGLTALHYAAHGGHMQTVVTLLNQGADREAKDKDGRTARDHAKKYRHNGALKALDQESNNQTTLHRAAAEGRVGRVQQILDRGGVDLEKGDASKWTALHCAAMGGHSETVKLLLDRGAVLQAGDENNTTALHLAAQNGHSETVKLLLDRGARLQAGDENNTTALHLAAQNGHNETVKLLLDRGAVLEMGGQFSRTALHLAAQNGHNETVKLLLDRGAALEVGRQFIWTALHLAAQNGHSETVKLLLDRGAVLEAEDKFNTTALHFAAQNGHSETVKLLLDREAILHSRSKSRRTALHFAAEKGHSETVNLLLDRGAILEAEDKSKMTALHFAAEKGHSETVKLLLDRGANPEARDIYKRTPLRLVRLLKQPAHTATVQLLMSRTK